MNTTSLRPNAPSETQLNTKQVQRKNNVYLDEGDAHNMSFVFNHTQHDQSQNNIYLVNFSFPPGLNAPFEAHPQNQIQQNLPRQIFQSSSAVQQSRNDAQLIVEFFGNCLDNSLQGNISLTSFYRFVNKI